jgi:MerR family redox-sensitive transcriptional activator SoxR
MTIGEVAQRAGVRASAVRYYESIGLMPRVARVSGRRVYDTAAVDRLAVIQSARRLGFGVREIQTLVDENAATTITDRWRSMARRKLPELEALIGRASRMKRLLENGLDCGCVRMEDCILHECAPPAGAPKVPVRGRLLPVRASE